jgi:hypothetical protein
MRRLVDWFRWIADNLHAGLVPPPAPALVPIELRRSDMDSALRARQGIAVLNNVARLRFIQPMLKIHAPRNCPFCKRDAKSAWPSFCIADRTPMIAKSL